MAKKYSTYWYQEDDQFRRAFLYQCRDNDVTVGGSIAKGAVLEGVLGYCIAEAAVSGYSGRVVPFKPNRRCIWQGIELPCQCHPAAPASPATKNELRGFNYVVADLTAPDAREIAEQVKLPVVNVDGKSLANLELDVFQSQGRGSVRRAKLL